MGRRMLLAVVCTTAIIASEPWAEPQVSKCKNPNDLPSIASTDSNGTALVLQPFEAASGYKVSVHLRLRNEGPVDLKEWCFWADLTDYQRASKSPTLYPACIQRDATVGSISTFDLSLPVDDHSWPLSGVLVTSARGLSYEKTPQSGLSSGAQNLQGGDQKGQSKQIPCEATSKEVARDIVIAVPYASPCTTTIVWVAAGASILVLLGGVIVFQHGLNRPMGAPTWNFTSSWATNVVVAGGVLTPIVNASVMPDYPHFLTKQGYSALALLFAAVTMLAPVTYIFYSKPTQGGNGQSQGTVRLFLVCASITICGAVGQLSTLFCILLEFNIRGYFSDASLVVFCGLLFIVSVGIIGYTLRNAHAAAVYASTELRLGESGSKSERVVKNTNFAQRWTVF